MSPDNSLVLVDTSVVIEYFNRPHSKCGQAVWHLINQDRACISGIVMTEILQGSQCKKESEMVLAALTAVPYIEIEREDWVTAGLYSQNLRSKGTTIPVTDMILAMLCLRKKLFLFTLDKHFDHIKELKRYRV